MLGVIARVRPGSKKPGGTKPRSAPLITSVSTTHPRPIEGGSKVELLVDQGVVEVHDPRLFRAGRESFCRAMVETAVGPGRARKAEVRLGSASFRIEFEPGRFNRDELAGRVVSTLKAASSMALGRAPEPRRSGPNWTTLTALAMAEGPSIWETLADGQGGATCRRRSPMGAPPISEHSGRPLRGQPRPIVRPSRPRAHPVGVGLRRPTLPAEAAASSRRAINLALAGGSFALAVAGVILPGIPSLPFLLLTGHYLIRSSPELCGRLEHLPGVGALLQRAEEMGSLVVDRRSLAKMLGVAVLAASAFLILHPPLPIVILLEMGVFAYYGFRAFRKSAPSLGFAGPGRPQLA